MIPVSVVIPCYRYGRLLAEAVDSALAQTHPAVQVVVVNDGSDDDTDAVARRYGDRITYVSQPNAGLSAARNSGAKVAAGEYLLFLDADDRLAADGVAALLAEAGPDRLVIGRYRTFAADDLTADPPTQPDQAGLPPDAGLLVGNLAAPFAYLCPAGAVAAVGGFLPAMSGCEDWDLWLRLIHHGLEARAVPETVGYYRLHPGSMTQRFAVAMPEFTVRLLRRTLFEWPDTVDAVADRTVGRAHLRRRIAASLHRESVELAYALRRAGRPRAAAATCLRAAWQTGPSRRLGAELVKAAGRCVAGPPREGSA